MSTLKSEEVFMNGSRLGLQRGVGLIEVLITLLILSTSLLGLAVLQTRSLQYNQDSYFRSQANIIASDIFDRMRIYTSANNTWAAGSGTSLNLNQAAKDGIAAWKTSVAASLPGGNGTMECDIATRMCTATIFWTELNAPGRPTVGEGESEDEDEDHAKSSFSYTARL